MGKFAAAIALVCVLLCGQAIAARTTPLVEPEPVAIPAGFAPGQSLRLAREILLRRDWTLDVDEPERIEATLRKDDHVLRIAIREDAQQIRFGYVSSEHLNYAERDGIRIIHPAYGLWTGALREDVRNRLSLGPAPPLEEDVPRTGAPQLHAGLRAEIMWVVAADDRKREIWRGPRLSWKKRVSIEIPEGRYIVGSRCFDGMFFGYYEHPVTAETGYVYDFNCGGAGNRQEMRVSQEAQ